MKNINTSLKQNFAIQIENIDCLEILGKANADLKKQINKKHKITGIRNYSAELRTFDLTLHYHSAAAHRFVRNQFDTCLPHSKTIAKKVEYDGKEYHGFVDMGSGADMDGQEMAKEAIVFMVIAINSNWKVPLGYLFLVSGLTVK